MEHKKKLLKNMVLSSVDLCHEGCNPNAEIKLTKSKNLSEDKEITRTQAIMKAWSDSCESIQADASLNSKEKMERLQKNLRELNACIARELPVMAGNQEPEEDDPEEDDPEEDAEDAGSKTKNDEIKKGKKDKMEMLDENKMSVEDKALLEKLTKKYALTNTSTQETTVEKTAEIHPEVKKALDEVADLKKSFEMKELVDIAKKYEVIGKKAPETAQKLYALRKSGGTAYDDYVALMDELAVQQESTGVFKEFGSNKTGAGNMNLHAAVEEIKKARPTISPTEAIELAYRNNPDLSEI